MLGAAEGAANGHADEDEHTQGLAAALMEDADGDEEEDEEE